MTHAGRLATLAAMLFAALPGAARDLQTAPALKLHDCRISAGPGFPGMKAQCGVLPRPLDPSDPDSPTIDLKVAVVPALTLEPEPDPLVPIAGGPGQSTIEFYAAYANAFEKIRRNRDIVLLDQRGTGDSAPLTCDIGEDFLQGNLTPEHVADEAKRCLQRLDHDPRFFTTSVAVTDLEALRQALGYPAFNVYGISYGTRVAQHFLRQYPESTRSVILDGVVPPQIALGPAIAIKAQDALDKLFARCAESAPCDKRFPGIAGEFQRLDERLAAEPQVVDIPDPVTGKGQTFSFGAMEFAGAIRILSYRPETIALIPLLIHEAFTKNYEPIAAQYLVTARSLSDALSIGMHNAVVCTEDAPFFEGEDVSREQLESTYMGPLQVDSLKAICDVWPAGVYDENLRTPVKTDKPVLLLSGSADPITPPPFAILASVDMTNKTLLVGKNQGHGQLGGACMSDIMADFVAAASVTAVHADCLQRRFVMPFFLDFTGPAP